MENLIFSTVIMKLKLIVVAWLLQIANSVTEYENLLKVRGIQSDIYRQKLENKDFMLSLELLS